MSQQPPHPHSQVHVQKHGWDHFVAGFGYAFNGLWYTLRTQRNMRVHATITFLAILLGIFLHISAVEFAIIFIAITGVFVSEMFNTVLELCVDLASPGYHSLAKIAKDVSAGAVLVNAILSVLIGLFIFGPHLLVLLRTFNYHPFVLVSL